MCVCVGGGGWGQNYGYMENDEIVCVCARALWNMGEEGKASMLSWGARRLATNHPLFHIIHVSDTS